MDGDACDTVRCAQGWCTSLTCAPSKCLFRVFLTYFTTLPAVRVLVASSGPGVRGPEGSNRGGSIGAWMHKWIWCDEG